MVYRKPFGFLLLFMLGAIVLLQGCARPDPSSPEVMESISEARNLGLAYLEENRLDEAEEEFLKVIDLQPDDASSYANLGVVSLRRYDLDQAESYLRRAYELAPEDPSISLSLTDVLEQSEQIDLARSVIESALEKNPDHVPSLYKRAQLYRDDDALRENYIAYLEAVIAIASANVVPRFQLIESLSASNRLDEAIQQLSLLRQQLPELPREAFPHFDDAVKQLEQKEADEAYRSARIFHNVMKVTPYYQTSLRLLGLRTDASMGTPVISEPIGLTQAGGLGAEGSANILERINFVDATANAGIDALIPPGHVIWGSILLDFDSDGETDLLIALQNPQDGNHKLLLFQNRFGRFSDVTDSAGITNPDSRTRALLSVDYDNDTLLDLLILNEENHQFFRNNGDGTFNDVSRQAGIITSNVLSATFADLDHDGDLDLFIGREDAPDQLYQNNADGTFSDISDTSELATESHSTYDVDFGDFDDDGDLDLLLSTDRGVLIYSNDRQGSFTPQSPLHTAQDTLSRFKSAIGDYNNDGFLDVFTTNGNTNHFLLNQGDFQFQPDETRTIEDETMLPNDVLFLDFDNDGYLDLLLAGSRLLLYHNDGAGQFADVTADFFTELDPSPKGLPLEIAFTDYNVDRDLDIFVHREEGMQLLRNDGGQLNRMLSIQPRGLVSNNSKNNYHSIGAKIELRAGDLYQTRVVTEPVTYFGLGNRIKADVIRIVFTNGVPQNIFRPGTEQDIIEQQILKGSCPFLYTWNGTSYSFATDLLWRSALGMPLGIMGNGTMAYAPADPAEDYIMIPDGALVPHENTYRIKITDELWETPFIDEVKLLVVDHPVQEDILIDEKFGPPPSGMVDIYRVHEKIPARAFLPGGHDISDRLSEEDDLFAGPIHYTRYQGMMHPYAFILNPSEEIDPEHAVLYLKGWIFPTDASINVALSQSDEYEVYAPRLQVRDAEGNWKTVIPNIGFPMGKNKVVRVDLSGTFLSADQSVRIESNMQIYWNSAFFVEETSAPSIRTSLLSPIDADLQFRGFSKMYRNTPFGPHLFDHDEVSTEPRWLDLEGMYTRYGDVAELLQETNDQYVIMNAGDALSIRFNAEEAHPLEEGWKRRFILYTNGWLKDGDLNIASGQTVAPLPHRGMTSYPYEETESYPMTEANRAFLEQYVTREVTRDSFREWMKP